MGKIVHILYSHALKVGIFIVIFLYFVYSEGFGCKIFTQFTFDSQAFLFWQFAAIKDYIPVKDIFYPYGILFFYKDINIFFQCLFFAIPSILCLLVFYTFKKISHSVFFGFLGLSTFLVFIKIFTGFESMGRYGVSVIYAILFAFLFAKEKKFLFKTIFLIGISVGLVFSLLNDQGIYAGIVFIALLFFHPFVHKSDFSNNKIFLSFFLKMSVFSTGLLIGLIPLSIYLLFHQSFFIFYNAFLQNGDIALFAKTPFPPYAASPENIFTSLILFITLGVLLTKKFIYNSKFTTKNFFQLSLCILLILFEQKSIIRSIDSQITFVSLLLYFILFIPIHKNYKEKLVKILYFGSFSLVFLICIILVSHFRMSKNSYISTNAFNTRYCISENKKLFLQTNKDYADVLTYISKNSTTNTPIFSYPADPVFYLLFNSSLPYYQSTYEATPLYGQKLQIAFMKNKNVEYVIYNTKILSIQDGVPDYIRSFEEQKYIFTHFTPVKVVGKFLIMKRNNSSDFFLQKEVTISPLFMHVFENPNLGNIPKSESLYKSKSILPSEVLIKGSPDEITAYLSKSIINSKDLFIFIKSKDTSDINFILRNSHDLLTRVAMRDCTKGCIVDVTKLPLFYTNRRVENIDISAKMVSTLYLFRTKNPLFW